MKLSANTFLTQRETSYCSVTAALPEALKHLLQTQQLLHEDLLQVSVEVSQQSSRPSQHGARSVNEKDERSFKKQEAADAEVKR